jgi:hypothetical protein
MKPALLLIPAITDGINRAEYLQICIDKMQGEDFVPISPNIYDTDGGINQEAFINNVLPFVDVVYLFIDFGIDKQMFNVIDRCVSQKIEIKYKRNLRVQLEKTMKAPQQILFDVCKRTGFTLEELKGKCRKRELVDARFIYFRRAKEKTKASLSSIGKEVNKDHATVLHGINEASTCPELVKQYERYYGKTNSKAKAVEPAKEKPAAPPDSEPVERPVLPYRSMDKREQNIPASASTVLAMPARGYYNGIGGYRPHNS